jgi:hypothetical protein
MARRDQALLGALRTVGCASTQELPDSATNF